jgi:hypothetical protein
MQEFGEFAMVSIKSLVAALALGTALIAAPAAVSAKVIHKHTTTATTHKKPSKLHKSVKHTHKPLVTKHTHASKLTTRKTTSHKLATAWKHHRSI